MIAPAQLSDRLALDVQGAQALRAGARAGDPAALRAAAKQFEALVVQMMLKNMRQTRFAQEGDVLGESNSLKLYRDMLDQQWAQKMVAGKGFGFAEMMVKAMESRASAASPEELARLAELDSPAPAVPLADEAGTAASGVALERGRGAPAAIKGTAVAALAPLPDRLAPPAANDVVVRALGAAASRDVPAPEALPDAAGNAGEAPTGPRQAFLDRLRPHAEQVAAETGVPARFILAHAALETGWGRQQIRKADGSASHNLFGIKAGRNWGGEVVHQETTEYQYGVPVRKVEPFRAYASYTEAFRDYAGLLARRYQEALRAGDDAAAFARGLAAGGYASDPNYAGKLRGVIASLAQIGA